MGLPIRALKLGVYVCVCTCVWGVSVGACVCVSAHVCV